MIAVVEGPPGSGKSYSCVCRIADALEAGKYVATNVELKDDWARVIARSNPVRRLVPGLTDKARVNFSRRLFVSGDLDELMRVRMPGTKEGRGVMVLDEAHNWCNARSWHEGDRDKLVRFFSQHRKLGWDVYLITQRAENIDAQIRSLAEYRITLRNLRRFKVCGVPLLPFNLFLALWSWEGGVRTLVKRDAYRLRRRIAALYDTLATSHGLEADDFVPLWLPLPSPDTPDGTDAGPTPADADGGAVGAPAASLPSPAVALAAVPAVASPQRSEDVSGAAALPVASTPSFPPWGVSLGESLPEGLVPAGPPAADPSVSARNLRGVPSDPYPPLNAERAPLAPVRAPKTIGDAAPEVSGKE